MDFPKECGGRFVVGELIIERPNCFVFSGTDSTLNGLEVVIKVFVDRPSGNVEFEERFKQEMTAYRSATHQALVPILQFGVESGYFFVAMERLSGPTFREFLKNRGEPMDIGCAVDYITELAEGVAEVHERGLVHGHIDSHGILFKGDSLHLAGYCPCVIEEIQKQLTSTGRFLVSPTYIAPEQVHGADKLDGRVDMFALSVVLYEMLTGKSPFIGKDAIQTIMMRMSQNPKPPCQINSNIPSLIDAAILKGLSRNPDSRFRTMGEFVDAINAGRRANKNPLSGLMPERLGTETIAVSMSTNEIKKLLNIHDSSSADVDKAESGGLDKKSCDVPLDDTTRTVVGQSVDSLLSGALMFLSGDNLNERIELTKDQMMIGSDNGCDVHISDRSVPARYAIIVKRGSEYYVGPLSAQSLRINGKEVKTETQVALIRGDVLHVGKERLRFIAPGEVFTFDKNVSDRVIDRKVGKSFILMTFVTCLLVSVAIFAFIMYRQKVNNAAVAQKKKLVAEQREREGFIDELIREGDAFIKSGALMEPQGNNAEHRFRSVLDLDPSNTYAKQRLAEIDERIIALDKERQKNQDKERNIATLIAQAEAFYQKGQLVAPPGSNARETYQSVLRIDANNQIALTKLRELDEKVSGLYQRVNNLLAQAEEQRRKGQYVAPKGENAFEFLQEVLSVDSSNKVAQEMLLDMASMSIFQGDRAKARLESDAMLNAYRTAEILGVDPEFLASRRRGMELMNKSKAKVVIYDRKTDGAKDSAKGSYINSEELRKRIAALELRLGGSGNVGGSLFIDLGQRK